VRKNDVSWLKRGGLVICSNNLKRAAASIYISDGYELRCYTPMVLLAFNLPRPGLETQLLTGDVPHETVACMVVHVDFISTGFTTKRRVTV
jgi:hypothetical protein